MIKLIKRLLRCNQRKEKTVRLASEIPDTSKYYKIKVNKYYGLQGLKYNYGVCQTDSLGGAALDRHIDSGGLVYLDSGMPFTCILAHLIPKGGILISKEEYLKGVENEK